MSTVVVVLLTARFITNTMEGMKQNHDLRFADDFIRLQMLSTQGESTRKHKHH